MRKGRNRPAVKLVVLDADGTLWDHKDISETKPPFRLVDKDTLQDARETTVTLSPGVRRLLEELYRRRITVSLDSWNKPEPTFEAIRLFGIHSYLKHPQVQFHPNKHFMIKEIIEKLRREGVEIRPEEILYIDDRNLHANKIRKSIGRISFLLVGRDIATVDQALEFIKE